MNRTCPPACSQFCGGVFSCSVNSFRSVHLPGEKEWPSPSSGRKSLLMQPVFVSVLAIPLVSPLSVVFVPVAPLSVSILLLIFVIAAVPVMVFMVRAASVASVISGRCPAAVAASVPGVAPPAPSCGGVSGSGLTGVPLQAGGAQGVEEEAFVGAPQGTLQPDRGVNTHTF